MKTWQDYRRTMRAEAPLFDYARDAALDALRAVDWAKTDIDAKNHKGYSALMLAAYHGHVDVARYLLQRGADANTADGGGNSALMGAAFKGYIDTVRLLIEYGADIDARNAKGQTATDFAHLFGRVQVARFLKQCRRQPQTFGLRDMAAGWISFFFNQRRYAK